MELGNVGALSVGGGWQVMCSEWVHSERVGPQIYVPTGQCIDDGWFIINCKPMLSLHPCGARRSSIWTEQILLASIRWCWRYRNSLQLLLLDFWTVHPWILEQAVRLPK